MGTVTGLAFQRGQHICAFYSTSDEQLSVAADYIAEGLAKNERCLYAADSAAALDQFRDRLHSSGTDAVAAESRTALLLLTKHQAHLADGQFDSERMLNMLNAAVEDALNNGFAALRTCGDMTWLLDNARGSEQVVEYEGLLNQFFRQRFAVGMCQYDVTRLPLGLLDHAGICSHPTVVLDRTHKANPFCVSDAPEGRSQSLTFETKVTHLRSH